MLKYYITIDGKNSGPLQAKKSNIGSTDDIITIEGLKEDLLASDKNFKQLFNSSHIPQWMFESDSLQVLFVNNAAIKQYGYSEKEFLNMTILEIAPPEEIQKLTLYNEFMKTTHDPFTVLNLNRKRNGERILAETTYFNITYKEQPCVLVTSSDITEKIKLEEKIAFLKVTRQQKITLATIKGQEKERDLIGKELHDNINQLLTSAKLYLEFAKSDEELRINFIDRGEKILEKAINEIRTLSNSLTPPTLKDISFKDSLEELFETYQITRTFNITLEYGETLDDLDQEIKISLFRIIQEQLTNILRHAHAKNIMISMGVTDQIFLSITDDGRGFDPALKRKGSGITNMRNRVELYNGTMEIHSNPQQGCSLLVNIPNDPNDKRKDYRTVLIVEDDPDDQDILSRAFTEVDPHYKITCLNDGRMLVDHLHALPDKEFPALIVLDYNMPLLNGLETLKVLELDQRYNKIPKIIYSSSSANYIKNLCYSANAKAYITKGITMDEIKENVQEMLSFV